MSDQRPGYSWRAMTSVLISLAFVTMLVSGVILLLSPPGRIANWSDWRMLGYTKHDWSDLHVWFAIVFVIAGLLHIVLNIRLLVSYFRNRLTRRVGFRLEWIVALAIAGVVFAGTRAGVPPFSTFLAFSERIKQSWEDPRSAAPMPHAELLTVQEFAEKAGIPLPTALERLSNRALEGVAPEIVVAELASRNDLSAQRLYEIMRDAPARTGSPGPGHADEKAAAKGAAGGHRGGGGWGAGGGPGRMTLSEYCESRGLDVQDAQARLQAQGIKLTAGRTLREIASDNGYDRPFALIEIIEGRSR